MHTSISKYNQGETKKLSKAIQDMKPTHELIFIPIELNKKIEEHAKQKGVSVDQEATELLELAIKTIEVLLAAKDVMKGGDTEL
jgi:hypothetical protein